MTYQEYIQNIIDTRGQWNIPEGEYFEKHHIIAKCLGGEGDYKNGGFKIKSHHKNCIWLYPQEHYEAHKLLANENKDNFKLIAAWYFLSKDYNEEDAVYFRKLHSELESDLRKNDGNPMYGKHQSKKQKDAVIKMNMNTSKEEYHRRAVKSTLTRKANGISFKGGNNPAARKVRCIETNEIFQCIGDAVKKYGGAIGAVCKCKRKTAAGMHWEYIK